MLGPLTNLSSTSVGAQEGGEDKDSMHSALIHCRSGGLLIFRLLVQIEPRKTHI